MNAPFYRSQERVALLRAEARSWLGTPFRQGCRVKGPTGGVDCVGLNLSCYEASGFAPAGVVQIPAYDIEHYEHSDISKLEEWFRGPDVRQRMKLIDEDDSPHDGDTCFIRYRRAVHHVALWADGGLFFTMRGQGAMHTRRENLKLLGAEMRSVFRPIEMEVSRVT